MHIVTLGEILIDMFPAEVGRLLVDVTAFLPKPGGAPANVAVAARRLGADTAFIGKVGDDLFGAHLIEVLREAGVETRGMRMDDEARTTMAIIAMPDEHTAEFVFYRNPGADLRLTAEELDEELLGQTRALHLGSLSLVDEPGRGATFKAIELARQGGALISFDVNYRPSLWRSPEEALVQIRRMVPLVDLIKVNEVELRLLQGEGDTAVAAAALLEQGPTLCVLTRGAAGSSVRWADGAVTVPAFAVPTVDATGCGDAFVAGLLTQLTSAPDWRDQLTETNMRRVLRYANAVGAITAQTKGVIPALPTAVQVEAFLSQQ
jgi:fructokinase